MELKLVEGRCSEEFNVLRVGLSRRWVEWDKIPYAIMREILLGLIRSTGYTHQPYCR